jgi:hypothetical protein
LLEMRCLVITCVAAVGFSLMPMVAHADPGSPGSTFPEQPGPNVAQACATILSLPDVGGGTTNNPIAEAIASGLIADACFGGEA